MARTAKALYMRRSQQGRQQFLQRARHNALLTIPSLMPLDGHDHKSHLLEPYNGLGAAVVIHLASRITMNLLPANRPHMRLDLPNEILLENGGKVPEEAQRELALAEKAVQSEVEHLGWRVATLQSMHQLLVCGNVCENMLDDGSLRVFRLDQYTCVRDYAGDVIEAVIEEKLDEDTLPDGVSSPPTGGNTEDTGKEVKCLYTLIEWDNKKKLYHVTQELEGQKTGIDIWYEPDDLPYNFLRWSSTPGEDYGRSKVEEHVADFRALDGFEKAGLEMAAMASRNFIAVRPGTVGASVKRRLTKAVQGDVLMIDPDSVGLKSFENVQGYQIIDVQMNRIVERLSRAFLLQSAGQRNAERVTATEIERDINELEAALGGNFSILNHEMMLVRTQLLMRRMEQDGRLPEGLNDLTESTILTGLEALSRERDVARVRQLIEIAAPFGPEVMAETYNTSRLFGYAAIGVGLADVINSAEEKAEIQKQRQQAQMAQQLAGQAGQLAKAAQEE